MASHHLEQLHAVLRTQTGASRHLRVLREAGRTEVRPDGQRQVYALREDSQEPADIADTEPDWKSGARLSAPSATTMESSGWAWRRDARPA